MAANNDWITSEVYRYISLERKRMSMKRYCEQKSRFLVTVMRQENDMKKFIFIKFYKQRVRDFLDCMNQIKWDGIMRKSDENLCI
jgi:hypothetical protein